MKENKELLNRLIVEKADLDSKIERLQEFITSSEFYRLPSQHRHVLLEQYKAMGSYSVALLERGMLIRQKAELFGDVSTELNNNTEEVVEE